LSSAKTDGVALLTKEGKRMDKPKFTPTPGPWRLGKCSDGFYNGEIRGPIGTEYEQDVIADWVWEANAHLIAAAPDLYNVLQEAREEVASLFNRLGLRETDSGLIKKIDAALAKAEGRTDG